MLKKYLFLLVIFTGTAYAFPQDSLEGFTPTIESILEHDDYCTTAIENSRMYVNLENIFFTREGIPN